MVNRYGPNYEPCGTPNSKGWGSEEDLPMWTDYFLPLMSDENHWSAFHF